MALERTGQPFEIASTECRRRAQYEKYAANDAFCGFAVVTCRGCAELKPASISYLRVNELNFDRRTTELPTPPRTPNSSPWKPWAFSSAEINEVPMADEELRRLLVALKVSTGTKGVLVSLRIFNDVAKLRESRNALKE